MDAKIFNIKGQETGTVQLPESIYGRKPKKGLLHESVVAYLANQRAGSAHTKTRGEVSGGGKKPWRQKGTGRARAGSIRSPLWRKGGVSFGPRNTVNWSQDLPKSKRKAALAQALSACQAEGRLRILEDFSLQAPKTKEVVAILKALKLEGSVLFVLDKPSSDFARASRNIARLQWILAADVHAYAALRPSAVVITQSALGSLARRWSPS